MAKLKMSKSLWAGRTEAGVSGPGHVVTPVHGATYILSPDVVQR